MQRIASSLLKFQKVRQKMKAYKTKEGCWQLSYMNDGKQRTIYLGKHQTAVSADRAGRVLSELILCRKIGESPSLDLVKRFSELGPKVQASFERHGLMPERGAAATLADLIRLHEPTKVNTKRRTQDHYDDWYNDLKLFFGGNRRLASITKGDAELMRAWLFSERNLSEATVARGIRR